MSGKVWQRGTVQRILAVRLIALLLVRHGCWDHQAGADRPPRSAAAAAAAAGAICRVLGCPFQTAYRSCHHNQPGGRYLPAWQDECTGNGTSSGHAALCVFAPAAHRQAPGAAVKPTLPWESHIASARPALISTRAFYGAVLEGGASNKGPPVRTQFNERGLAAGPVSAAVVDVAAVPPLESSTGPRSTKHKPSLASPASGARTEKKKAGGGPPMPAAPTGLGLASTHDACGWRPPISARAAPPPLPCVAPVSVEPASFRAQDRPSECQFITHRPISQCQSYGITLSPWAIPRPAMAIRMPYSLPPPVTAIVRPRCPPAPQLTG